MGRGLRRFLLDGYSQLWEQLFLLCSLQVIHMLLCLMLSICCPLCCHYHLLEGAIRPSPFPISLALTLEFRRDQQEGYHGGQGCSGDVSCSCEKLLQSSGSKRLKVKTMTYLFDKFNYQKGDDLSHTAGAVTGYCTPALNSFFV